MWLFGLKGASGFSASSTAEEVTQGIDANGLTAIVTGINSFFFFKLCLVTLSPNFFTELFVIFWVGVIYSCL